MTVRLWQALWLFGILERCLSGTILQEPLDKKICKADYVFRFQITSRVKVESSTSPTTTKAETPTVQQGSGSSDAAPSTTVVLVGNRTKRYILPSQQDILISKNDIYKGSEDLKKMDAVKVVNGTDYYKSFVRHSLNFETNLKKSSYIFVGTKYGKVKDYIFFSNPYTVEPWNNGVEDVLKNLNCLKKTGVTTTRL